MLHQSGIHLTDLNSRPALADGVFQCLVDDPHRNPILQQRKSQNKTGGPGTDLSRIRIRSTSRNQRPTIRDTTHNEDFWWELRIYGVEHVGRMDEIENASGVGWKKTRVISWRGV